MNEERPTGQYAPLSPWAYFGLGLLYSIPIIGLIFMIVFSIKKTNINRRNFTLSYWIFYVVALIICIILAIILAVTGTNLVDWANSLA